jgi:hypothetical protein
VQLVRLLDRIYKGLVILSILMMFRQPSAGLLLARCHSERSQESLLELRMHDAVSIPHLTRMQIKEAGEGARNPWVLVCEHHLRAPDDSGADLKTCCAV